MSPRSILPARFSGDILWNAVAFGVLTVCGLAFNFLIVNLYGNDALGLFGLVFAIYIILSQFSIGGLHLSVLKHVSHNQDDLPKCAVIVTAALIPAVVLSAAVCLAAWFASPAIGALLIGEELSAALRMAIPGILFLSVNKALHNALNGLGKMRAFAVFYSLRGIATLASLAALIAMKRPASDLPLALTLGEIILFIGLFIHMYANLFAFRIERGVGAWIRVHLGFGARGFLGGVFAEINTKVDVLMLGYFIHKQEVVGVYFFAAMLAEGFSQIPMIVRKNVDPILGRCFAQNDRAGITRASREIRKWLWPAMIGGALALAVAYPLVLPWFAPPATVGASRWVFCILIAGVAFNAFCKPFLGILLQGGRPGSHTLLVALVVACNIVLNWALIPLWGIHGAAAATSMVYALEAVFIWFFALRLLQVRL